MLANFLLCASSPPITGGNGNDSMKSTHRMSSTLPLLLGWGAIACTMTDDGSFGPEGTDESVVSDAQPFNPGPPTATEPYKGHHDITKKAIFYLARRGLLPATLANAANQNLVLYGNEFGDHSWLGRPEAPTTSVPTRQTANRSSFSSDSQHFQFEIPHYWEDPNVNTTVAGRVAWFGPGSEWQHAGGAHPEWVNPRMAQTALHYQVDINVSVDVWGDWFTEWAAGVGDQSNDPKKQDHTMDNLFHYALGSVHDYGLGLPGDASSLKFYPFNGEDVAETPAEYAAWDANHKNVANGLAARLVNQPLMQGSQVGADKYGAILFQLARKFFVGSPAEPRLSDLQKAGNSVSGWNTGAMQGIGVLTNFAMTFPHTYLGGNPNVCNGSGSDPCAAGTPTWPIWVPATTPTASTLGSMEVELPGRSDRAALIYLGWATHMMQDLAAPHHAANWTGKQHELQDSLGDTQAYWKRTAGQEQYFMDDYVAAELDTLLGPTWAPKTREQICSEVGITDSQIPTYGTNFAAVRPVFLNQAKNSYLIRKASGATIADGAVYMKNAIVGTMKLLLCSTPSSVPTVYQNAVGASAFVWAGNPTGSYVAHNGYAYTSANWTGNANHSIAQLGTGQYRVDFTGVGDEIGGNVQVTAYGWGSERCKVGGWGPNGAAMSAWINCHDVAGQPVDTQFTASYHRRGLPVGSDVGGYVWADQPGAASYAPSKYYSYNSSGQQNTITRYSTGSYYVAFPGVSVNGGMAEVTAYGSGSEHCSIGWWSGNGVQVNCYANGGVPADSMFTLNFTDQNPIATPSYQYVWASDPWSSSYTPDLSYQKGAIASCQPDAGTVTIQRFGTGYYVADFPKMDPMGSNVKATAYGWSGETCKVGSWYGNGGTGTQVYVMCFDPSGNPVDAYFDLAYASRTYIIC
jgi:hypothetical protein